MSGIVIAIVGAAFIVLIEYALWKVFRKKMAEVGLEAHAKIAGTQRFTYATIRIVVFVHTVFFAGCFAFLYMFLW